MMRTVTAPEAKKTGDSFVNPKMDISVATMRRKTRNNASRHEVTVGIRITFSVPIPAVDTFKGTLFSYWINYVNRIDAHLHFLSVLVHDSINVRRTVAIG